MDESSGVLVLVIRSPRFNTQAPHADVVGSEKAPSPAQWELSEEKEPVIPTCGSLEPSIGARKDPKLCLLFKARK
jgi:hypothetical protein